MISGWCDKFACQTALLEDVPVEVRTLPSAVLCFFCGKLGVIKLPILEGSNNANVWSLFGLVM